MPLQGFCGGPIVTVVLPIVLVMLEIASICLIERGTLDPRSRIGH